MEIELSLFEKLYRYRQNVKLRGQKENFLTEIFAHCLKGDIDFQKNFLKLIKCNKECEFECDTQVYVDKFVKPDITIKFDDNSIIFVECKVDSPQGKDQLKKYALSLLKDERSSYKQLIFLTKGPEKVLDTENLNEYLGGKFQHIRWYQIFELLKNSSNEISKELSEYLKAQKMDTSVIPFTISDVSAIAYIKETKEKMDRFLMRLEHILKDYTNEKIRPPSTDDLVSCQSQIVG